MDETNIRQQGGTKVYWALGALALAGSLGEAIIGLSSDILGLVADAIHAFGDALAIGLVLWYEAGHHARTDHHNHRLQRVIQVVIGLLILGSGIGAGLESLEHWHTPVAIHGWTVIGTATLCGTINRAMLYIIKSRDGKLDADLRRHIQSDFRISIGVALGGALVQATGQWWLDPLIGSVISASIIYLGIQVIFNDHKH